MNLNGLSQALFDAAASAAQQTMPAHGPTQEPSRFDSMLKEKDLTGQKEPGNCPNGEGAAAGTQNQGEESSEDEMIKSRLSLAAALLAFQPQALSPELMAVLGQNPQLAQGTVATVSPPLIPLADQAAVMNEQVPVKQTGEQSKLFEGVLEGGLGQGTVSVADAGILPEQTQGQAGQKGFLSDLGEEKQSEVLRVESGAEEGVQPDIALFRRVETVPIKVAQPQQAELPAENMVKQIALPLKDALAQGASKMEVSLSPRNLGTLTVEITRSGDGSLYILLSAATEKAANLLEHHSSGIQNLLAGDSQAQVRIEVQHQGEHQTLQQFLNPEGQGRGQQGRQQQRQQTQTREMAEDFVQQLRLGLIGLDEAVS